MRLNIFKVALSACLMLLTLGACSDDDNLTPLTPSTGETENAAYNSLTFEWGKVQGAVQYSYQLTNDATGEIVTTDITQMTSVTIYGLEASTDYTLTVLAYVAIGSDQTTSSPIVLKGRTADLQSIGAPEPVMTREVNTIIFEWEHVTDAEGYYWELLDSDHNVLQSGDIRTLSVSFNFSNMPEGNYIFSIVAECSADGKIDSAPATVPFQFTRIHEEIWRNSGKYTSELTGSTWNATIVAYDDNSYTIFAWYGAAGYNFSFSLDVENATDMFKVSDTDYAYNSADKSYAVPTGIASPATVYVFPANNQCAFEGDSGKGSVQLYVSDGSTTGTDRLTWGNVTIDDLVAGQWSMHTTCDFYGDLIDDTKTVTFTKINDTTIEIPTPEIWGNNQTYLQYKARMVIDFDTMTYTIQPVSGVAGYYTFASAAGETVPLTGSVNNASISVSGWDMWYAGWSYISDSNQVFTRL